VSVHYPLVSTCRRPTRTSSSSACESRVTVRGPSGEHCGYAVARRSHVVGSAAGRSRGRRRGRCGGASGRWARGGSEDPQPVRRIRVADHLTSPAHLCSALQRRSISCGRRASRRATLRHDLLLACGLSSKPVHSTASITHACRRQVLLSCHHLSRRRENRWQGELGGATAIHGQYGPGHDPRHGLACSKQVRPHGQNAGVLEHPRAR